MKKLNKTQARKSFEAGETIIIVANKISPNNIWGLEMTIQKDEIANSIHNQTFEDQGFDFIVDRINRFRTTVYIAIESTSVEFLF